METDRDRVWDPMQEMVPLQQTPNFSYTSNQTYKNILVKSKKCSSQMETKKNKKSMASKIIYCK